MAFSARVFKKWGRGETVQNDIKWTVQKTKVDGQQKMKLDGPKKCVGGQKGLKVVLKAAWVISKNDASGRSKNAWAVKKVRVSFTSVRVTINLRLE